MHQFITLRQAEEEIRRRGREMGLPGDPLADAAPVADDMAGQRAAVALWLELPGSWRRHPEAWTMAQATAHGPRRRALP